MERKKEMKTKKLMLIIVMLASTFLFVGRVFAAGEGCSYSLLNELRQDAANIKVTYVPGEERVDLGYVDHENGMSEELSFYLDLKIYNVTDQMYLNVQQSGKTVSTRSFGPLTHLDIGPDGSITLRQQAVSNVVTYTITVISNYNACAGERLRTIKITLPKYNVYSDLLACDGISDYYLCHEYTTYDIDGATFYDKVDEYKSKLLTSQEGINGNDNNTIIGRTFNGISKYRYLIVGVIVAIGVIVTVIILKRKKGVE